MPWSTPTLREVRSTVRDSIRGRLPGADANVPNSVLRVLSDAEGALCHLTLQYIDWLALQLLPDTAETEWLDRHGDIWLKNADGTIGRKLPTTSTGTAAFPGQDTPVSVPIGTQLTYTSELLFETTQTVSVGSAGAIVPIKADTPGAASNLPAGTTLGLALPLPGFQGTVTVDFLSGGSDEETDDELRARILARIQHPPAGGDADDYVQWTLAVPGVTRAWCSPGEMGPGTVTVRFMCDDLRADVGGFPNDDDILAVETYLAKVRPVAVKDLIVVAPIPYPVNFQISNLVTDDDATRQAIENSVGEMILERAAPASSLNGMPVPAQTIYREWVSAAISDAPNVDHFDLTMTDAVMPDNGSMGVLGDITYA